LNFNIEVNGKNMFSLYKSLLWIQSVFESGKTTNLQIDVTGFSTVSFDVSVLQVLRPLQLSNLHLQTFIEPNVVWNFFIAIFRPFLAHTLWRRNTPHLWSRNWAYGGCDRSAGDAYASYAPDRTPCVSKGPCKSNFYCGLFLLPDWTLILTTGLSVYLTGHWFWQQVCPSTWSGHWFWPQVCPSTWSGHWFWPQVCPFTWLDTDFDCGFVRLLEVLILIADSSIYLIWTQVFTTDLSVEKWGLRQVWPVDRGCLLLLGTWSHLRYVRGSVLAHLFLWLVIPTCVSKLITGILVQCSFKEKMELHFHTNL
jgi:hypothetical protein